MIKRVLGKLATEENRGTRCGPPRICVFHKPVVPSRQVSSVFPERRKLFSLTVDLVLLLPKDTGSQNSLH